VSAPLVVCSLEAWDEIWRRNQFMIAGLLDRDPGLEVLFVEPAADPINDLRSRRRPQTGNGFRRLDAPGAGRLHTLQPTKWLPRVVGPPADRMLRSAVLRAVRRLGWHKPNLWINDPGWAALADLTGWPALYDITDDWLRADRGEREHDRLVRNEATLLRLAREVVVCSPELERVKGAHRPVTLIPNAVDVGRMRTPVPRPVDLPDGPVAVYAGTLHEDRLDVGLVLAVATALDQAGVGHVVLVGPNALTPANTARLSACPRVALLGPRPYAQVPGYLQHAAALIVPHVVDAFTDSLDPIKLYEYLAAGRPVISTPVAGFRDSAAETVLVADGEDFAAAVVRQLQRPAQSHRIKDVPDWSDRVAAMATVISRLG
jgi:glycosyltransferase involved in cell wall biosynthesis